MWLCLGVVGVGVDKKVKMQNGNERRLLINDNESKHICEDSVCNEEFFVATAAICIGVL